MEDFAQAGVGVYTEFLAKTLTDGFDRGRFCDQFPDPAGGLIQHIIVSGIFIEGQHLVVDSGEGDVHGPMEAGFGSNSI